MVRFRSAAGIAAIVGLVGLSGLGWAREAKARYAQYAIPADGPVHTAAPPPGAVAMHAASMPCPLHGVPMGCGQGAGCTCVPNARWFGYFPTLWRVWPCEPRPDKAFPQAIGSEPLPTPPGAERVPLPVEKPRPPEANTPQDQGYREPVAPSPPVPPSSREPEPPAPNAPAPGMPGEAKTPTNQRLPGLPPEPAMDGSGIPGLPPQPPAPFPLDSAPPESGARAGRNTSRTSPGNFHSHARIAEPESPIRLRVETGMASSPPNGNPRHEPSIPAYQVRTVPDVISPDVPGISRMAGTAFDRYRSTPTFAPVIDVVPQLPVPRPALPQPAERPQAKPEPRAQAAASPATAVPPALTDAIQPRTQPRASQPPARPKSSPPGSTHANAPAASETGIPRVSQAGAPAVPAVNLPAASQGIAPAVSQARPPTVSPASASAAPQASAPPPSQASATPAAPAVDLVQHVEPTPPQEFPMQLDGYCPVELIENEKWLAGDQQWAVAHRGRLYTMSGAVQQQRFLANPDRYAPVFSGVDPVLAVDEAREVPGKTAFCAVYDGRLFVFSNAATLAKFRQSPRRYAQAAR